MSDATKTESPRLSTFRAIARIYPYAKPAMPRIYLGMVAALLAGIVALLIPQVLRDLVDGPLSTGDSRRSGPRSSWCSGSAFSRRP